MQDNPNVMIQMSKNDLREIIGTEVDTRIKQHLTTQNDRFMKRNEAAEYLRITLPTIDKLFASGELTKYQVSGRILVKFSEVQRVARKVNM